MDVAFLLVPDGNHELVPGEKMEAAKARLRDPLAVVKEVKAAVQVREQTAAGEAGVIETPNFKPRSVADIMNTPTRRTGQDEVNAYLDQRPKKPGPVPHSERISWWKTRKDSLPALNEVVMTVGVVHWTTCHA